MTLTVKGFFFLFFSPSEVLVLRSVIQTAFLKVDFFAIRSLVNFTFDFQFTFYCCRTLFYRFFMTNQSCGRFKTLFTTVASIGLFARVRNSPVNRQQILVVESFAANFTLERLLRGVRLLVPIQGPRCLEGLGAKIAAESSSVDTRVNEPMTL